MAEVPVAADALAKFVAKAVVRSPLTEAEQQILLGLPYRVIQVASNRDFVRLGERVSHACLIASGLAGRFGQARDGSRQIVALNLPGDMADLHSVVVPESASALQALAPTTVVQIPHAALKDVAAQYPAIAEAFWRECVIDAAIMAELVLNMGRRNAVSRMAHLLCEVTCRYNLSASPTVFDLLFPATQTHLSDALGLTPVHVNRTLRQLREAGLATVRERRIVIHDWRGLVARGDFNPSYLQL